MIDDQIKELLMKEKQKEKQSYLSNIHDYSEFIDENSENPRNIEYMFNILRDIGYLEITGLGIERELIEKHTKHFIAHNSQGRGSNAPSYIDFDDLMLGITRYVTMWNEFNKLMPNTQKPGESQDHDNIWDDMWWELKDCALELILCGIDMYAVTRGYDLITQNGAIQNNIWKNSWDDFCHNKDIFYKSLCQDELVQFFYLITDDVNKFLNRNYNHEKSDTFIAFLITIAESRETYPEDYCYSHVITSDETDSIYKNIKEVFKDYPSSAWFYYYKNALAERTIKHFLRWVCHAKASGMVDTWKIASSSESNHEYKQPNLVAGHNEYSIHMLSHPKNKGWGILKDRLNVLFTPNRQDYKGALFFSMKRYQTGNILVRFENYMSKEELLQLYNMPEKEILKDYYKFSFDDVYKEDKRKGFFQEAAKAVLSPVFNNPFDYDDQYIKNLIQEIAPFADQENQIMACPIGISFQFHDEDDEPIKTKIVKDIVIDNLSKWNNILKSYDDSEDMNKFLEEIENMPSKTYYCGAAVLYTDSQIINLGVKPVVVSERRRKKKIETELQADIDKLDREKFAIIFVGISDNQEQLETEIKELCNAVEEKRKYNLKPAKEPVIWIRYIFKYNIKAD